MSIDVIVYLGDYTSKKESVEQVLTTMGLSYKFLTSDDLAHTIGYLLELNDDTKVSNMNEVLGEDLMVFRDIEDEKIIQISKQLNELDSNIPRKAMLTEHNIHWSLYDLLLEIREEHHYFNVRGELIELIQTIMKKDQSNVSSEEQMLVLKTYDAVQKETPIEELESLLKQLKED